MSDLVLCPGGCGQSVHPRATVCPHCGYPAEIIASQEQLSSLSTVCSILVGFGLAGLVQLGTDVDKVGESVVLQFAVGCWLFSSFLLLVVLVLSELHRRQEVGESVIDMPPQECLRFARHCERLLSVFSVALLLTAVGFVLLGFHFSIWHGLVACVGVVAAVILLIRALR